MSYKDNAKPWFELGDYPTQQQFYQAFDWLRWKDEAIDIAEIDGLTEILNSLASPVQAFLVTGDQPYIIPVGFILHQIIIKAFADCEASCNEPATGNPEDVVSVEKVTVNAGAVWTVDLYSPNVDRTIVVSGVAAGSTVYFIKRKLA